MVWSIPALTVILLGGVAWIGAHQLDPAAPVEGTGSPVRIQVVSLDWKWLFIYPDQRVATVNTLTVPVGAPLQFELTSASVMNVFFIPQLGSMIYTMNGMVTRLNLRADQEGDLSGPVGAFQRRRLSRHAVRRPRHIAARVPRLGRKHGARRSGPERGQLQQARATVGRDEPRPSYRLADPELFGKIATQQIPPGPGPQLTTDLAQAR